MTEYLIMEQINDEQGGSAWYELAVVASHSSQSAIAHHVKDTNRDSGVFVAVPRRSFDPVRVETKTTTSVQFTPVVEEPS